VLTFSKTLAGLNLKEHNLVGDEEFTAEKLAAWKGRV
jgi:hypothetical protein